MPMMNDMHVRDGSRGALETRWSLGAILLMMKWGRGKKSIKMDAK